MGAKATFAKTQAAAAIALASKRRPIVVQTSNAADAAKAVEDKKEEEEKKEEKKDEKKEKAEEKSEEKSEEKKEEAKAEVKKAEEKKEEAKKEVEQAKKKVEEVKKAAPKVAAPIKEKAEKAYSKFKSGKLPKMTPEVKAAAQKAYDRLHAKGVVRKTMLGSTNEEMKNAAFKAWNKYSKTGKDQPQTWPIGEEDLGEAKHH